MTWILNIINLIDLLGIPVREKPIRRLVVHRFGGDDAWWAKWAPGRTGAAISAFFRREAPGGVSFMPYGFIIWEDGTTEQTLPLTRWGWHAKGWSIDSISIAVIGDFRKAPPTQAQINALMRLCEGLALYVHHRHGKRVSIHGHTELKGASGNPDHDCPGEHLDLGPIREHVGSQLDLRFQEVMQTWGLTE